MAKKEETKIILERTYNVPLRRRVQFSPRHKRAKKAVNVLRDFLKKHMKSDQVKIGKYANLEIWKHGIKNVPHHIKVDVKKDDKGVVFAELAGAPVEKKVEVKKAEVKKEVKAEEKEAIKKDEKPNEIPKDVQIEKEELKELKKEPLKVPKEAKSKAVKSKETNAIK
ncbi:MAG: 50S ribosomal protein L31e [Candidatus Woesearchaeota archaeon]|nr:50S ribosomal protein L31e [Candidatus Woesearchaeota archaeon]